MMVYIHIWKGTAFCNRFQADASRLTSDLTVWHSQLQHSCNSTCISLALMWLLSVASTGGRKVLDRKTSWCIFCLCHEDGQSMQWASIRITVYWMSVQCKIYCPVQGDLAWPCKRYTFLCIQADVQIFIPLTSDPQTPGLQSKLVVSLPSQQFSVRDS